MLVQVVHERPSRPPQRSAGSNDEVHSVDIGRWLILAYRVTNSTRDSVLAHRSARASNPVTRGVGLIGRRGLPDGGGLIIQPCNSVVSFFMRFPIDVVFLDKDFRVLHMIHAMPLWRTSKIVRGSKLVIELPAGTLTNSNTDIGDTFSIEKI
jgi:uncharacterized membrane protein (UPF0127 family)